MVAETDLEVIVRLSTFSSVEHRLLDMQALVKAITDDPQLHTISNVLSSFPRDWVWLVIET